MLITPTGMGAAELRPRDLVWVGDDGSAQGRWQPSSEWPFHRAAYRRRPDVTAIVHTHAENAAALACLGRGLPAFHYMVAVAGGDSIRCAPYATFGTQALSDAALTALQGRKACLLAHHGLIVLERSAQQALALAIEVESLLRAYLLARQAGRLLVRGRNWLQSSPDAALILRARQEIEQELATLRSSLLEVQSVRDEVIGAVKQAEGSIGSIGSTKIPLDSTSASAPAAGAIEGAAPPASSGSAIEAAPAIPESPPLAAAETPATPPAAAEPPAFAAPLRAAGFAALTLANNHALDAGPAGLSDAAGELRAAGIQPDVIIEDARAARAPATCSTSPHTASPCLRNSSTSGAGAHAVIAEA